MVPNEERAREVDHVGTVLKERARALAQAVTQEDPEETRHLVVLVVAGERYGVDVRHVREVHPRAQVMPLPGASPWWTGLMNLRGSTYPVLDLARYLGLPGEDGSQKVLVASHGAVTVALLVDHVLEVLRVPVSAIRPPLAPASGGRDGIVAGLTADLLSVLDVEALFQDPALAG
jgi:purine-binding chemotaxis protein CheW